MNQKLLLLSDLSDITILENVLMTGGWLVLLHLTEKRAISLLMSTSGGEREKEKKPCYHVAFCCHMAKKKKKRNITRLEKGVVAVERTFAVKDQTKTEMTNQ